jgi:hypothetical protein
LPQSSASRQSITNSFIPVPEKDCPGRRNKLQVPSFGFLTDSDESTLTETRIQRSDARTGMKLAKRLESGRLAAALGCARVCARKRQQAADPYPYLAMWGTSFGQATVHPGGIIDNGPTFQRWGGRWLCLSLEWTAENIVISQPSLRDFCVFEPPSPNVETLGNYHISLRDRVTARTPRFAPPRCLAGEFMGKYTTSPPERARSLSNPFLNTSSLSFS